MKYKIEFYWTDSNGNYSSTTINSNSYPSEGNYVCLSINNDSGIHYGGRVRSVVFHYGDREYIRIRLS